MPSARLIALIVAIATPALAAAPEFSRDIKEQPAIEACQKAVDLMGASLGSKAITADNGAPAILFLVRANGLDYEVICDAATGVVSDVAPREG